MIYTDYLLEYSLI